MDLSWLAPIVSMAAAKYGIIGQICAYLVLVGIPVMSVLIEVLDAAVKLIGNASEQAFAGKVDAVWAKVMPVLEVLPHVNLPLSPVIVKVLSMAGKVAAAAIGAIKGWTSGQS